MKAAAKTSRDPTLPYFLLLLLCFFVGTTLIFVGLLSKRDIVTRRNTDHCLVQRVCLPTLHNAKVSSSSSSSRSAIEATSSDAKKASFSQSLSSEQERMENSQVKSNPAQCLYRDVDQVVLVLVDALRPDFVFRRDADCERSSRYATKERGRRYPVSKLTYMDEVLRGGPTEATVEGRNGERLRSVYRQGVGFFLVADSPTTTAQRLKALSTGTIPAFVEAGANFNSDEVEEDSLMSQLRGEVAVLGDDTWLQLFHGTNKSVSEELEEVEEIEKRQQEQERERGKKMQKQKRGESDNKQKKKTKTKNSVWQEAIVFPSFDIKDLHGNDWGVLHYLFDVLSRPPQTIGSATNDDDTKPKREEPQEKRKKNKNKAPKLLIAHFLGVDHAGHRYNAYDENMEAKIQQIDVALRNISRTIQERGSSSSRSDGGGGVHNTMLLVLGDHGMTDAGDHGGDSHLETDTFLFAELISTSPAAAAAAKTSTSSSSSTCQKNLQRNYTTTRELLSKYASQFRKHHCRSDRLCRFYEPENNIHRCLDIHSALQHQETPKEEHSSSSATVLPGTYQVDVVPTIAALLTPNTIPHQSHAHQENPGTDEENDDDEDDDESASPSGVSIPYANLGRLIPEILLLATSATQQQQQPTSNSGGGDVSLTAEQSEDLAFKWLAHELKCNAKQVRRYLTHHSTIDVDHLVHDFLHLHAAHSRSLDDGHRPPPPPVEGSDGFADPLSANVRARKRSVHQLAKDWADHIALLTQVARDQWTHINLYALAAAVVLFVVGGAFHIPASFYDKTLWQCCREWGRVWTVKAKIRRITADLEKSERTKKSAQHDARTTFVATSSRSLDDDKRLVLRKLHRQLLTNDFGDHRKDAQRDDDDSRPCSQSLAELLNSFSVWDHGTALVMFWVTVCRVGSPAANSFTVKENHGIVFITGTFLLWLMLLLCTTSNATAARRQKNAVVGRKGTARKLFWMLLGLILVVRVSVLFGTRDRYHGTHITSIFSRLCAWLQEDPRLEVEEERSQALDGTSSSVLIARSIFLLKKFINTVGFSAAPVVGSVLVALTVNIPPMRRCASVVTTTTSITNFLIGLCTGLVATALNNTTFVHYTLVLLSVVTVLINSLFRMRSSSSSAAMTLPSVCSTAWRSFAISWGLMLSQDSCRRITFLAQILVLASLRYALPRFLELYAGVTGEVEHNTERGKTNNKKKADKAKKATAAASYYNMRKGVMMSSFFGFIFQCVAWVFMFSQGLQCIASTIDWNSAFVGMSGYHLIGSGTLVVFHTYASFIVTALMLPQVSFSSSSIAKLENDAADQAPQRDEATTVRTSVRCTGRAFLFIAFLQVSISSISIVLHRRHLMLWAIFCPKYLCDVGAFGASLLGWTIHNSGLV